MAEKFRVPLDFTLEGLAEIDRLRTLSGANTRAETIRYAVRILDWVTEQMNAGNRIAVERNGNWQEVVFPFLPKPKATQPREIQVTVGRVDEDDSDRARDMVAGVEELLNVQDEPRKAGEQAQAAGRQAYRDATAESGLRRIRDWKPGG